MNNNRVKYFHFLIIRLLQHLVLAYAEDSTGSAMLVKGQILTVRHGL